MEDYIKGVFSLWWIKYRELSVRGGLNKGSV